MSRNAGRPHKTGKNTDTSKNRHRHCWCYVFITQEKHISSAVRTELDLRGDVSGSTAPSHATNHELLEIKVRTLCSIVFQLGVLCLFLSNGSCQFCFSWGLSIGFFVAINLKLIYYYNKIFTADALWRRQFPAREMMSGRTRVEILYWTRFATQAWIVHPIGSKFASTN